MHSEKLQKRVISMHYLHWQSCNTSVLTQWRGKLLIFWSNNAPNSFPTLYVSKMCIYVWPYVYKIDWLRIDVLSCQNIWRINSRTDMKYKRGQIKPVKEKTDSKQQSEKHKNEAEAVFPRSLWIQGFWSTKQIIGACKIWRWSTKSSKDLI